MQTVSIGLLLGFGASSVRADYAKGMTMFQIYGGGASVDGHYRQPGVNEDEQKFADGGGLIGGQFLYFTSDSVSVGFDISHAGFDSHLSNQLLTNRQTDSSASDTLGQFIGRLSFPRGHFRPYIQGGFGGHYTRLDLKGHPINGTTWSDTGTIESRDLVDNGHAGLAISGAVGIHIYFTERFFIGAEYKRTALMGRRFDITNAGAREGLLKPDGTLGQGGIGFMLGLGF